jgi:phosphate:Na+ symporter
VATIGFVSAGLLTFSQALGVIIGANIGTTSIAAIAAIGATAPAKRVAAAHFIFNALTAVIALLFLPWLVELSERIIILLGGAAATAPALAVFHTVFNCIGVLAIAGVTGRLVEWLSKRFVTQEERIGRPRYLDATLVGVPALATRALTMEAARMAEVAFDVARTRISEPASGRPSVGRGGLVRAPWAEQQARSDIHVCTRDAWPGLPPAPESRRAAQEAPPGHSQAEARQPG